MTARQPDAPSDLAKRLMTCDVLVDGPRKGASIVPSELVFALATAVSETGPIYAGPELTEVDLMNLKPGPIQVVYPLDEEWNAALEAAITAVGKVSIPYENTAPEACDAIRALKRSSERSEGSKEKR